MSRSRSKRFSLPNWVVGGLLVFLVLFGLYLAFVKRLPFTDRGWEVKAVFANAQNVSKKSPVRIAGVNVGEVIDVEPMADSNAALLTMTITDSGRPLHEDVRMQLRPRLFLEGNLFVDVRPGSPSADELEEGDTIPLQQTSNSVQLDEILTTLQADVRGNLQVLLRELGDGFLKYGGAEGLRDIFLSGGPAYFNTALVNEAFLGTEPGDLARLIRNFDRVAVALNQPGLPDLITNLRTVTGSFAAEDDALAAAIRILPSTLDAAEPAFANLNTALPFVRAFAIEALPGVRSTPAALDASLPLIQQLRGLVSEDELRGLVADLRPTIPALAALTRSQLPFLEQARALSSCFNEVVIPWSSDRVGNGSTDRAGDPIARNYEEAGYGLVGIGGESRSGDANGQYIKVGAGGGVNTVTAPNIAGLGDTVGVTPFEILGSEPARNDSRRTRFKPKAPCENQERPNLESSDGAAPAQRQAPGAFQSILDSPLADTELAAVSREAAELYMDSLAAEGDSGRSPRLEDDLVQRILEFNREEAVDYIDLIEQFTGMDVER